MTRRATLLALPLLLCCLAPPARGQDPPPAAVAAEPGPFLAGLLDASKPLEIAEGDDDLAKLRKQLFNVAVEEFRERHAGYQSGQTTARELFDTAQRLYDAEIALAASAADRIAVIDKNLKAMTEFEVAFKALIAAGLRVPADLKQLQYHRLTLKIDRLEAKRASGNAG